MASIQEKLSVLANTIENDEGLSQEELEEEKNKVSIVDFKMVTFSLSGKDYAIDIMKVKEIAKADHFTYVPNALPFVLGVYNLRGDIIPIIDLRIFFNIDVQEHVDGYLENLLIVVVGGQTFGVVVDKIDKVVGIQKSSIQPPHPLFGDINIKYIYGVVESNNNLYVLLDIDRIFGLRAPEEERELAEMAKKQMKLRVESSSKVETTASSVTSSESASQNTEEESPKEDNNATDLKFIIDSLKDLKKFYVTDITEEWVKKRYEEWVSERGKENTQLQNEADANKFLAPFYSKNSETWWTEDFADSIFNALPSNSAKNIVVWNPGCGKGYETYSLACLLKKKYQGSKIKVYGQDVDLLSVSNAPLMTLPDDVSSGWYEPYTSRTASGEYTFSKDIKDSIMFEYHDCVNTNNLPPTDIVFARDLLSFLPEASQATFLSEISDKIKGNGVIIVGDNENLKLPGWSKKQVGNNISMYLK